MKSGKIWVIGLLAFGALLGLGAVLYWTWPSTRVKWSFAQIHSSLLRGRRQVAGNFVAERVRLNGTDLSHLEFLDVYTVSEKSGTPEEAPCPSVPGHYRVRLLDRSYCFLLQTDLWKLHWVGEGACRCREMP